MLMNQMTKFEKIISEKFKENLIKNSVSEYRKNLPEETEFLNDQEIYMMNPLTNEDIVAAASTIIKEYQNEINRLKYSIQDGKIFANDIPDARQEIMEYEFMIKTITEAANKLKEELNDKRGR